MNDNLYQRSIDIILENQTTSGAYLASPNFPTYRYCWFRDGAYIAYAMDIAGEYDSAARFHNWAADMVNQRSAAILRAIAAGRQGRLPDPADQLHTRYTAEGEPADEDWPNFQLDGLGTWLWAMKDHYTRTQETPNAAVVQAAGLTADYLAALWELPCYDCWEEYPEDVHTYTLAAIFGGLLAAESITGRDYGTTATAIRSRILTEGVADGRFAKCLEGDGVDANLLALATRYDVVAANDPRMQRTAAEIANTLTAGGGVHRYAADTYYGGGQWVLLTAWLGEYLSVAGRREEAESCLQWIEAQATAEGWLPEQIPARLNAPDFYEPWQDRWGEIASPLLWSHAEYIVLKQAMAGP